MAGSGSGGYEVRTDELATHAKVVQQVASDLGQALSAAEQVTMGVQAYGLICGPLFVPMVVAVSTPGLVTLKMSEDAVSAISDSVSQAVSTYEETEQAHAKTLQAFAKELS